MKRFGLMLGAVMAAPVDVTHSMAVAAVSTSPAEIGAGLFMASAVLDMPVAEKSEQGIEVATPATSMRAKFQVASVERFETAERVKFNAVGKSGG